MKAFIDTDILIWHLKGAPQATNFLKNAASMFELWTGAMQRAEITFMMRSNEVENTYKLLTELRTAPLTEKIVDHGSLLYRQWNPGHGIDINDALLAATAYYYKAKIFSLNTKHYPMPEIQVERAWE